jgi:5-methylcytosine-specific restriction endonuclease McrA
MIRLTKGVEPEILQRKAAIWTNELLEKIANKEEVSTYLLGRYAHPEVKAALLAETFGKCAYCESPLRHVTYGDIEHIIPKSAEPTLRFSWVNLTIACDVCNTNKSDKQGLVDPYQVDPSDLFSFHGPLIWAITNHDGAILTEHQLDLNRAGLIERRCERIDFLRNMVASASTKPPDIRQAMLVKARREVGNDKPFSACGADILRRLIASYDLHIE